MPRHPIQALGLAALALTLTLGPGPLRRAATAQEHAAPDHAAEMTPTEAADVAAGHGAEGEKNILEPQPSLAIWTVVVFVGLLLVLRQFAWKPLLAALHSREEHLEHVLHETEKARNATEELLAEQRRRLADAEGQMRAMIDEARRTAQTTADDITRRAQDEADAAKKRAERDITTAKDQALSEIWSKTADLAVSVAGKVLGRSLGEDDHRRLIDQAVGEVDATRAAANGHQGGRT